MQTMAKSRIFKQKAWNTTVVHLIPLNAKVVINDPPWKIAIKCEYKAFLKNNTWTLVTPPLGAHTITCKWIFKNKYNSNGYL